MNLEKKELLLKNYKIKIKKKNKKIILRKKGTFDKNIIHPEDTILYLSIAGVKMSKVQEEAERLYQEKKAIKTTGKELYCEFLNLNEEEWSIISKGYDLRTSRYLEKIKKEIGYKYSTNNGCSGSIEATCRIWDNTQPVIITKCFDLDNTYHAEYSYETKEGWITLALYFDHFPEVYEIEKAHNITILEQNFKNKKIEYIYKCKKCNKKNHWLDQKDKSFSEKVKLLKQQICDC